MTVTLTSPVEGKQPGDTYTGANEAYLLASGYASQAAYAGPGVANTGDSDTAIATNREFDATRGPRAKTGGTPQFGTNDPTKLTLVDGSEPVISNSPTAGGALLSISSVLKPDGTAATGLAAAGGATVRVRGFGFRNVAGVAGVKVGGTNATSYTVLDDQRMDVVVPAKAAGTYDVLVTRPDASSTKTGAVTYV